MWIKSRLHMFAYHEAQVAPLIQEISVDIDAVWLRQIFGDQLLYCRKPWRLFLLAIANVSDIIDGFCRWACGLVGSLC